jgi:hypothetical protein
MGIPLLPNTTFPDGPTIRQRIGLLCWWGCNGATVLIVVGAIVFKIAQQSGWNEVFFCVAGSLPVAAVIWSAGRGALFFLTGR